jgi:tetratricopeptide (TPR) repeat protein
MPNPIERAVALHDSGKTPVALKILHRLPASDPHYKEAQDLIAQWEAPAATEPPAPPPLPADAAAHRDELLAAADQAVARHDNLAALRGYEAAAALAALDPARDEQLTKVRRQLEPLGPQIELFKQHEWELAIPALWRLRETDPGNADITRLIVDSYYDLGVRDLQRGETDQAVAHLAEALKLAPDDGALKRHYLFAQSYQTRQQDLLYHIYAKYLPLR